MLGVVQDRAGEQVRRDEENIVVCVESLVNTWCRAPFSLVQTQLVVFLVSILAPVKSSLFEVCKFRLNVSQNTFSSLLKHRVSRDLKRFEIYCKKPGIILSHLLEVGYRPIPSRGVSEEPVLNMIVEPSSSHLLKSLVDNREHLLLLMVTISHKSIFERVSLRKLRLKAKSTVVNVKIDRDGGSNILGNTLSQSVSRRLWHPTRFKLAPNL